MDEVPILRTIDSALTVQNQTSAMPESPKIPESVKGKTRHIWIVFRNETQFKVLPDGEPYFSSGSWTGESMTVSAYGVTGFGGMNTSWLRGCVGGARFKMGLDERTSFTFVIGFSSPNLGNYKAHVEESDNAKDDGHDKATDVGNSITSKNIYRGTSKNGVPLSFKLNLSAVPGETMTVTISQDVFESK